MILMQYHLVIKASYEPVRRTKGILTVDAHVHHFVPVSPTIRDPDDPEAPLYKAACVQSIQRQVILSATPLFTPEQDGRQAFYVRDQDVINQVVVRMVNDNIRDLYTKLCAEAILHRLGPYPNFFDSLPIHDLLDNIQVIVTPAPDPTPEEPPANGEDEAHPPA